MDERVYLLVPMSLPLYREVLTFIDRLLTAYNG